MRRQRGFRAISAPKWRRGRVSESRRILAPVLAVAGLRTCAHAIVRDSVSDDPTGAGLQTCAHSLLAGGGVPDCYRSIKQVAQLGQSGINEHPLLQTGCPSRAERGMQPTLYWRRSPDLCPLQVAPTSLKWQRHLPIRSEPDHLSSLPGAAARTPGRTWCQPAFWRRCPDLCPFCIYINRHQRKTGPTIPM